MSTCAFFGHRKDYYAGYDKQIKRVIVDLIENHGVTEFYNGYRGKFDSICAQIVYQLKKCYPFIRNTMVLSYPPSRFFVKPEFFDGTVYLLTKTVPAKYAIIYTNREIVNTVDYIVSGVKNDYGGAWYACDYARKCNKPIISIFYEKSK